MYLMPESPKVGDAKQFRRRAVGPVACARNRGSIQFAPFVCGHPVHQRRCKVGTEAFLEFRNGVVDSTHRDDIARFLVVQRRVMNKKADEVTAQVQIDTGVQQQHMEHLVDRPVHHYERMVSVFFDGMGRKPLHHTVKRRFGRSSIRHIAVANCKSEDALGIETRFHCLEALQSGVFLVSVRHGRFSS